MWIHGVVGTFVGLVTIYSCAIMWEKTGSVSADRHRGWGFFFFIIAIPMILGGLVDKLFIEKLKWKTYVIRTLARIHKFSGVGVLAFGQWVIFTGIYTYYDKI